MKATDLMIGDWVQDTCGNPIQVKELLEDGINGEWDCAECYGVEAVYDDIKPIPLTAEILEKNGFIKVNSQRYDYGYPDTDCYAKVNPKKNMIHVNGRNANSNLYSHSFVHELQRALRLCGLNELADNFKI